jgi:hypothetical protein
LGSIGELRMFGTLENDTTPANPRYPAGIARDSSALMTSKPYGQGTYNFSSSSAFDILSAAFNAFDGSPKPWQSAITRYNSSGPANYIGTVNTTLAGGTRVAGEWLQMITPRPVKINAIGLISDGSFRTPNTFSVLGSTDGSTWISLLRVVKEINWTPNQNTPRIYSVATSKYYRYYRIVVESVGSPSATGVSYVSLSEFYVHGVEEQR